MATPHVAGVAALVMQSKPGWSIDDLRAAVLQTASPTKMRDYAPRLEGSGLVQTLAAVSTQAVIRAPDDSLSFGYADLLKDFSATRQVTVHNDGVKPVQFNITVAQAAGSVPGTITAPASVIVNAKSDAVFPVTLTVAASAFGGAFTFQDVAGTIKLTPSNLRLNNGVSLTVPYYLVAHRRSKLATTAITLNSLPAGADNLTVTNLGGALGGTPDFYSLGQVSLGPQGVPYADTRAIGVQTWPLSATDNLLVFAINTFGRFSNAAGNLEWDIYIDTTGTGTPDYLLVGVRGSAVTSNPSLAERVVSALIRLSDGQITLKYLADVGTDNATVLLPVNASDLGLSAAKPRFSYFERHFGADGSSAQMPGSPAKFHAFAPALNVSSSGNLIAPGGSDTATVSVNAAEWALTPALGLMIVAPDNLPGGSQAKLIPVN